MDIKIEDFVQAVKTAGSESEDSELIKKINSEQGYVVNTIAGIVQDMKKAPTIEDIEAAIASKVTDIDYCLNDLDIPNADDIVSNVVDGIQSNVEDAVKSIELDDSDIRTEISAMDDRLEDIQTSLLEVEEISTKIEQINIDIAKLTEEVISLTEVVHLIPAQIVHKMTNPSFEGNKVLNLNDSTIDISKEN